MFDLMGNPSLLRDFQSCHPPVEIFKKGRFYTTETTTPIFSHSSVHDFPVELPIPTWCVLSLTDPQMRAW